MHCIEEQNGIRVFYVWSTHFALVFALAGYSYNVLSQFSMDVDLFVFVQVHVEIFLQ